MHYTGVIYGVENATSIFYLSSLHEEDHIGCWGGCRLKRLACSCTASTAMRTVPETGAPNSSPAIRVMQQADSEGRSIS